MHHYRRKRPYISKTIPDEQRKHGDGAQDKPKRQTVEEDWIPSNYNLFTDQSKKSHCKKDPDKWHFSDLSPDTDSSDELYCPNFVRTGKILKDSHRSGDTGIENWSPPNYMSVTKTSSGVLFVSNSGSNEWHHNNDDSSTASTSRSHVSSQNRVKHSDFKRVTPCHGSDNNNSSKPESTTIDLDKHSATTSTTSLCPRQLIEEGDEYLKSVSYLCCAPEMESLVESTIDLRMCKLKSAVMCFKKALSCSKEEEQEALASRGVALAGQKLAALCCQNEAFCDSEILLGHYKESLKHFGLAYLERFCMGLHWGHKLVDSMEKCLKEFTEWADGLDMSERNRCWREVLCNIPDCRLKASGSLQYLNMLFDDGLAFMRKGNHEECLRCLKECEMALKNTESNTEGDPEIEKEVRVLMVDVENHSCLAEARLKLDRGDALLVSKEAEWEGKDLSKESVSDVIDLYEQAATLSADKDLQDEAIACSKLGQLYTKIGMLSRGYCHCKRVLELGEKMQPEMCLGKDWLVESRKLVEEFKRRLNTDAEETENKKEALANMEEDVVRLKELDKCKMSDSEFVRDLYSIWPPEHLGAANTCDFSEARSSCISQRKLLVKAISNYHPDKIGREQNWHYFAAEITKILTRRYNALKKS